MSVFIDVLGSIFAGSLVVLTIISSILNIQQMNYNLQAFLALNLAANHFIEVVDMSYFEPVGLNIERTEPSVLEASRNRFVYQNRRSITTPLVTHAIEMQTNADNRIFFRVTENGITVFNSSPVFFESVDIFTYYDSNFNEIADPAARLNDVYSVRVDLVFTEAAWSRDPNQRIRYPVTFWRFFKNIYLVRG